MEIYESARDFKPYGRFSLRYVMHHSIAGSEATSAPVKGFVKLMRHETDANKVKILFREKTGTQQSYTWDSTTYTYDYGTTQSAAGEVKITADGEVDESLAKTSSSYDFDMQCSGTNCSNT
jgi:hypothetical protein